MLNEIQSSQIMYVMSCNKNTQYLFLFQFMEWDAQNVILTGSSDGVVRVSSLICHFLMLVQKKQSTHQAFDRSLDREDQCYLNL